MMRSHVFPIVQHPIDPSTAALTDRATSGVSFNVGVATHPDFCDLQDTENPFVLNKVHSFAEPHFRSRQTSAVAQSQVRKPPTRSA